MNQIAPLLNPDRILLDVKAASKHELFEMLARHMAPELSIGAAVITQSLHAREQLGSTGLGQGVAIPHGRLKGIQTASGALIRLSEGLDFSALDGRPVNLLFVLFVPARATDLHLQILSEVAQLFGDKSLRECLIACSDSAAVMTLLQQWQPWSGA